jgi:Asp-tRNA(Asn)/Glu-tRNA(Gln) amidotransferase A subunit family amidase
MASPVDFRTRSLEEWANAVRRRELSARELTDVALANIDAWNVQVNAFVAVDAERARADADAIDIRLAAGETVGTLAGIPIGVKDLEDARGFVTTYGSAAHARDMPAERDSVLVDRLRSAGCVVIGKTNAPEFGLKPVTDNVTFGISRNPWDLNVTPGGSSGGTAAALAIGIVPLATGSDGGGSIRIPSAVCGLSGFKPSLGRVPSGDPKAPSWGALSTKGPMARRIRDVALALDAVVGPHSRDLRSLPTPANPWSATLDAPCAPSRVAWSPTLGYMQVDPEILAVCEQAVNALGASGVEIVEVDTVFTTDPRDVIGTLVSTYTLRNIEEYRGTAFWDQLDPLVVITAEMARAMVKGLDIVAAEDGCHRLNWELCDVLDNAPLLLTPTTSGITPQCFMPTGVDEIIAMIQQTGTFDLAGVDPSVNIEVVLDWLRSKEPINLPFGTIAGQPVMDWTGMTQPFNLTRSPAGTVCVGFTSGGLPVGLQVVGRQHADLEVLEAMTFLEDLLAIDRMAVLPQA